MNLLEYNLFPALEFKNQMQYKLDRVGKVRRITRRNTVARKSTKPAKPTELIESTKSKELTESTSQKLRFRFAKPSLAKNQIPSKWSSIIVVKLYLFKLKTVCIWKTRQSIYHLYIYIQKAQIALSEASKMGRKAGIGQLHRIDHTWMHV